MTLGSAIKFWLSIGCLTQEYMENITVALRFVWGVYDQLAHIQKMKHKYWPFKCLWYMALVADSITFVYCLNESKGIAVQQRLTVLAFSTSEHGVVGLIPLDARF